MDVLFLGGWLQGTDYIVGTWGVADSDSCVLCNNGYESHGHLFFFFLPLLSFLAALSDEEWHSLSFFGSRV